MSNPTLQNIWKRFVYVPVVLLLVVIAAAASVAAADKPQHCWTPSQEPSGPLYASDYVGSHGIVGREISFDKAENAFAFTGNPGNGFNSIVVMGSGFDSYAAITMSVDLWVDDLPKEAPVIQTDPKDPPNPNGPPKNVCVVLKDYTLILKGESTNTLNYGLILVDDSGKLLPQFICYDADQGLFVAVRSKSELPLKQWSKVTAKVCPATNGDLTVSFDINGTLDSGSGWRDFRGCVPNGDVKAPKRLYPSLGAPVIIGSNARSAASFVGRMKSFSITIP